ncbi:MAG: SusC/RagA family TonB-linked outer membrane protein [Cyclobacteriaceae bacterium]
MIVIRETISLLNVGVLGVSLLLPLLSHGQENGYPDLIEAQTDSVVLGLESDAGISRVVHLPFNRTVSTEAMTGPVVVITGEQLARYTSSNLKEALTGHISNGVVKRTDYSVGGPVLEDGNDVTITIRGFVYTTIVDGVVRPLDDLSPDEVESVSVLKGMSTRAMFGYPAADGLIVVTTKRGVHGEREISVNVEHGTRVVARDRMPEWLGAYEYASLYNQAAINDGADPQDLENLPYSPEYLEGYRDGSNPAKYYDEDLFEELFNNSMKYTRVNANYTGGSETTNYFINLNYLGEGAGYLRNKSMTYDQLRLRSNIDVKVTEDFSYSVDVLASLQFRESPLDIGSAWTALESYPVNAYPVMIAADSFGTSSSFPINPVADIAKRNVNKRTDRTGQVNVGAEYDLHHVLKGLSVNAYMSYDAYNYQELATEANYTYAKYEPVWVKTSGGEDSVYYNQFGVDVPDAGQTRTADSFTSRMGAFANLNYFKQFGDHSLGIYLNAFSQSVTLKEYALKDRRLNYSLSSSYQFRNKYLLDVILSMTGHQYLPKQNRFKTFPTVAMGWVLSKERFLEQSSFISFLKLRASYGEMGFFNSDEPFLYKTEWETLGATYFDKEVGGAQRQTLQRVYVNHDGNPNLNWAITTETNLGLDAAFLNNNLSVHLDYYQVEKSGLIQTAMVPGIIGFTNYYENNGATDYMGVDLGVQYGDQVSSGLSYRFGFNLGYNRSEVIQDNLPEYEYDWLNQEGKPEDAIYGFKSLGLFSDQADIENSPTQTYGAVNPGNIKYEDLNNDGQVTSSFDRSMIGHRNPRFNYALNMNLAYRGFTFYAMGTGLSKHHVEVQTNSYFHASGSNKYSAYVEEHAWTMQNQNPDALHPRLTTESLRNDDLTSSYWLRNAAFLKLKCVEIAYSLPEVLVEKAGLSGIRVFARGTNLLTLSHIDDLDPEYLQMGVSTYPSTRTITGGIEIHF